MKGEKLGEGSLQRPGCVTKQQSDLNFAFFAEHLSLFTVAAPESKSSRFAEVAGGLFCGAGSARGSSH